MGNFILGVFASFVATGIYVIIKWAIPYLKDKYFYDGVRIDGTWEITEVRNDNLVKVGRLELKQNGRRVFGSSVRSRTREGQESDRKFEYSGTIDGHQVTLIFEDVKGIGFDTGTYVFIVQNDGKTMIGMATFHGKKENRIVSESRTLTKIVS